MTQITLAASELVNNKVVRSWLSWGLLWIIIFPLMGAFVSIKFHNPDFWGGLPWLTFGRLRPIHVNGVVFGAFSTIFIGLTYYAVPLLCGRRIYKENWSIKLLWLWNTFIILGSFSLLLGYNLGFEVAEYEWPLNLIRGAVLLAISVQVLGTLYQRTEPRFYVSLWYITAAFVWTIFNLLLGNVVLPYGEITGTDSAALHGLYIHYIVGLWMTPAGLAIIYFFLPLSTKRALFSHKLSLLGFWALALFYPFVGTHHYIYSPIPHWTQTVSIVSGMMLILPVCTVTVNFFGTVRNQWSHFLGKPGGDNAAAKFLMLGGVFYLLGSVQGSIEGLRRVQELTHFNDFVIGHSHITVFGAMVSWVVGGMYYVWPRVTGRQLWSSRLANWHLALTLIGFGVMFVGLTIQGMIQGVLLEKGINFLSTMQTIRSGWITRTFGGLGMVLGLITMVFNFIKTFREGKSIDSEIQGQPALQDLPLRSIPQKNWLESPSTILVTAGIGFFSLAVIIQGALPLWTMKKQTATVKEVMAGELIQVAPYSEQETQGRQVYIREGCWYCHSQYIRPVTGESWRWGPVSQAGEHVFDRPHLLGTRRIGPDLTRVGRKYGDDWHIAHFWNPREVVGNSIMPRFTWLFEKNESEEPILNEDGKALISYIQRMGTNIGDWRAGFASTSISQGISKKFEGQDKETALSIGKQVYEARCLGCHGSMGDGKGPAAKFLNPKPRDFTKGVFKFRSTPGKDSLPTDSDLYHALKHGLWGTSMPAWYSLKDEELFAVIQYLKTFSKRWESEDIKESIPVPPEPQLKLESIENGARLYQSKCMICHGPEGKGNGPLAGKVKDTWGYPIQPANFTLSAGEKGGVKLGHDSRHLYITLMTGIGGVPMPLYQDQLSPSEIWDIVHYVQSLRVRAYENTLLETGLRNNILETVKGQIWRVIQGGDKSRQERE